MTATLATKSNFMIDNPSYDLDSVNEANLDALIKQLGLKEHSVNKLEPCCVICREHLAIQHYHLRMMQPKAPVMMGPNHGMIPVGYVPIYPQQHRFFVR